MSYLESTCQELSNSNHVLSLLRSLLLSFLLVRYYVVTLQLNSMTVHTRLLHNLIQLCRSSVH